MNLDGMEVRLYEVNWKDQWIGSGFSVSPEELAGLEVIDCGYLSKDKLTRENPDKSPFTSAYIEAGEIRVNLGYCPELEAAVVWYPKGTLDGLYNGYGWRSNDILWEKEGDTWVCKPSEYYPPDKVKAGSFIDHNTFDKLPLEVRLQKCKPALAWGNIDADGDCYHHNL